VPALFGASLGVFALVSTLFFFLHSMQLKDDRLDESARTLALETEHQEDEAALRGGAEDRSMKPV
jgi:hypothetical protein